MAPNLAQVLNTLAHEIRTPLAVSQGYLKLYLDGRLTDVDDTRKAFEQTRQALGMLSSLCTDMGKVSSVSESSSLGLPERISAADFTRWTTPGKSPHPAKSPPAVRSTSRRGSIGRWGTAVDWASPTPATRSTARKIGIKKC